MILTRPTCYDRSMQSWNSFCFCLTQVLPYLKLESELSYEEIMGYTVHAFHHNIQVSIQECPTYRKQHFSLFENRFKKVGR